MEKEIEFGGFNDADLGFWKDNLPDPWLIDDSKCCSRLTKLSLVVDHSWSQ